jgi:hypothetical protein
VKFKEQRFQLQGRRHQLYNQRRLPGVAVKVSGYFLSAFLSGL